MAKSKKVNVKQIVLTSIVVIALIVAVVGLCLPFLVRPLEILDDITVGLFKFEEGLGVTTIVFAIITLLLVLATTILTALKFTKVKVSRTLEVIVYVATIVFAVVVLVMTMAYCSDISKPLVDLKLESYTIAVGGFMFPIASIVAGAVAIPNK